MCCKLQHFNLHILFIHVSESDADFIQKFVQLFSVYPVKVTKGKVPWRATRAEILQGLTLHIKVFQIFLVCQITFTRKMNNLPILHKIFYFHRSYLILRKKYKGLMPLQHDKASPCSRFPLVVGTTIKDINSSYIVIGRRPILVETPLRALEVAFECYFALHCEYPIQSRRQWTVLQKTLFDLHVPSDRINPTANLSEVKRLMKTLKC